MFGYRPPVYRVPFDEAEHWSAGIPARTYPSGSRSGPTSKYPQTGFTHAHPDQSSGIRNVPRNRQENCGQGCPPTSAKPTVAESRTCEGRLPGRTCARVVGAKNCPDQREKAVVRGTWVRGHPCPHVPVWFPLRSYVEVSPDRLHPSARRPKFRHQGRATESTRNLRARMPADQCETHRSGIPDV